MIKINYKFEALTPLHTGSDQDAGIMKTLRRQKIAIDPVYFESNYTDSQRIDAIVSILYAVHKSLDWAGMNNSRKIHIWDECYSKILKASATRTRFQFFNSLCAGWGIRSVLDDSVIETLESLNDAEFFDVVRNETHYLVLKLRQKSRDKGEIDLFAKPSSEKQKYVKTYEMVPCISGNSIRGALRRLAMYDYCKLVGIEKLKKETYHQWFTGGMLNDSTQYEDVEKREKMIELNPMLAVFGSAIGNMTIESLMSVGHAYPCCVEVGTGETSYWEILDTIFQTRLDNSKTEKQIEIEGEKAEAPTQMKYEYEVFAQGTEFSHGFRMLDFHELSVSTFWHVIRLFKENPIICGMWARGNAEIDLSSLESGDDSLYLSHIEANKESINAISR
jgi:CRISPR/Cas system CMR subunit Cmr4 (Cas7 group RAMP superfamily)